MSFKALLIITRTSSILLETPHKALLHSARLHTSPISNMTSSKGEPTDPELREKVKEEVKAEEKGMRPIGKTTNLNLQRDCRRR